MHTCFYSCRPARSAGSAYNENFGDLPRPGSGHTPKLGEEVNYTFLNCPPADRREINALLFNLQDFLMNKLNIPAENPNRHADILERLLQTLLNSFAGW